LDLTVSTDGPEIHCLYGPKADHELVINMDRFVGADHEDVIHQSQKLSMQMIIDENWYVVK
jgi:hypothetical protein